MSRRLHTPELAAVEVEGMSRAAFLLRGTLAAGAMYGAGAVAPFVSQALAQSGANAGDAQVLGFALGLEQLEAGFYAAGLKNAKLSGAVKTLAVEFGQQEAAHVQTLKNTLSLLGAPPPPPPPKVKFNLPNQAAFLKLAVALEDLGVGAYNGAGVLIKSPDLLQAAGAIVQVEARHAAAMRFRAGKDPAPAAMDPALTPQQVTAALKKATA